MDKQEQVRELYNKIFSKFGNSSCYTIAEYLYDLGYRKIPENAVVLTREEYEKYQNLKRDVEHSFEYNQGYIDGQNKASKETAEKFSEKLKSEEHLLYGAIKEIKICNIRHELIDEIAKEFIGEEK